MKGTLRVVGGTAKGMRLRTVPGDTTRPITDIVKEALFNILGSEVINNKILDVFGGTGAVGIEALSRGADFVTFLDKSQRAVDTIRANLDTTRFQAQARVLRTDAFTFLGSPQPEPYDLIYIAPPQYKSMWFKALELVDVQPGMLSEDGQVIVQINPVEWEEITLQNLSIFDRRKYGDTLLIFFEKIIAETE
ncbi:MAG: 16S rRNA (guanine(966)-N(2))-methyltransferase RsmD [Anaerolineaceae bacterium]|jgi:16S rRNA (guanine966-N2)-methyltransferase